MEEHSELRVEEQRRRISTWSFDFRASIGASSRPPTWDGLSKHIKLDAKEEEETGGSEVVKITFAGDHKQPPTIEPSEGNSANDTGIEPIAVWTGVVWLITMKEANNTPGDMTIEVDTKEHGGDISPGGGIDNNVFKEASEIPHVHKELIQGNQHAGIEMIKPSTGWDAAWTMRWINWSKEENREMSLRI